MAFFISVVAEMEGLLSILCSISHSYKTQANDSPQSYHQTQSVRTLKVKEKQLLCLIVTDPCLLWFEWMIYRFVNFGCICLSTGNISPFIHVLIILYRKLIGSRPWTGFLVNSYFDHLLFVGMYRESWNWRVRKVTL